MTKTDSSECKHGNRHDEVGKPEEIAKSLHYYIDWLRACKKRTWDNRSVDALDLLLLIQKGNPVPEHYNGE